MTKTGPMDFLHILMMKDNHLILLIPSLLSKKTTDFNILHSSIRWPRKSNPHGRRQNLTGNGHYEDPMLYWPEV